tara:strand:- start:407 stop:712 length:306 start_codon:yes stop_codon:yes gene_type:complete
MSIWWSFYLFSVAASGSSDKRHFILLLLSWSKKYFETNQIFFLSPGVWLNWSIAGAVLLTLLFQGSTDYTEKLTMKKYPQYAKYQKTTSRLIPWFPGRKLD